MLLKKSGSIHIQKHAEVLAEVLRLFFSKVLCCFSEMKMERDHLHHLDIVSAFCFRKSFSGLIYIISCEGPKKMKIPKTCVVTACWICAGRGLTHSLVVYCPESNQI